MHNAASRISLNPPDKTRLKPTAVSLCILSAFAAGCAGAAEITVDKAYTTDQTFDGDTVIVNTNTKNETAFNAAPSSSAGGHASFGVTVNGDLTLKDFCKGSGNANPVFHTSYGETITLKAKNLNLINVYEGFAIENGTIDVEPGKRFGHFVIDANVNVEQLHSTFFRAPDYSTPDDSSLSINGNVSIRNSDYQGNMFDNHWGLFGVENGTLKVAGDVSITQTTFSRTSNPWGFMANVIFATNANVSLGNVMIDGVTTTDQWGGVGSLAVIDIGLNGYGQDLATTFTAKNVTVKNVDWSKTPQYIGSFEPLGDKMVAPVILNNGADVTLGDVSIDGVTQNLGAVTGILNMPVGFNDRTEFKTGAVTVTNMSSVKGDVTGITHINSYVVVSRDGTQTPKWSTITVGGPVSITKLTSTEGDAVGIESDNLTLSHGVTVRDLTGRNVYALLAQPTDGDGIRIEAPAAGANVLEGDMKTAVFVDPDTQAVAAGKISAAFAGAGSSFTGGTDTGATDAAAGGSISLRFNDGAAWNVTRSSTLTGLSMDGGTLALDVNLTDGAPDGTTQVDVLGQADGTFNVALNITGAAADNFTKSEDWVLRQESGTLAVGEVTQQNGGAQAYELRFFEDGAAADAQGSTTSSGGKGEWHVVLKSGVTDEVNRIVALGASVQQGLGMLSETEDLRMRLGDVRSGADDGLWARTYARKDSAHGAAVGFDQKTYGLHLGADRAVRSSDDASWLFGAAFHYGRSDMDGAAEAGGGSATVDQYSLKAYATCMKDNGAFADLVLHLGYYDTELTGLNNAKDGRFTAGYHSWGYGLSAEVGHRFEFGEALSGWHVEPTAQLTWFRADGRDFRTSTGLEISQSDADFITGRLGAAVGKTFALGTADAPMSRYLTVVLKGGMLYQFDGDQTLTARGTDGASPRVDGMDLQGARGYYGITADWKFDDAWRVYAQFSREDGSGYTKDYDASLGVRFEF